MLPQYRGWDENRQCLKTDHVSHEFPQCTQHPTIPRPRFHVRVPVRPDRSQLHTVPSAHHFRPRKPPTIRTAVRSHKAAVHRPITHRLLHLKKGGDRRISQRSRTRARSKKRQRWGRVNRRMLHSLAQLYGSGSSRDSRHSRDSRGRKCQPLS